MPHSKATPTRTASSSAETLRPLEPPPHASPEALLSAAPPPSGIAARPTAPAPPSGYAAPRASASSTSLAAARAWTPEDRFEAARIQLERGAIEEALAFASQACLAAPEHPKYLALHAWLRVERGELKPGPIGAEILGTLTWALRQQRTDLDIRLYRARVLQRLGRQAEAIHDFAVVARLDGNNLEAVRELRLYRTREEQASSSSGVFSRLFKRP